MQASGTCHDAYGARRVRLQRNHAPLSSPVVQSRRSEPVLNPGGMSAACYHFFNTHCIYRIHPPDWPEKDTHRNTSEKMSDGHVKIEWEDKLRKFHLKI